MVLSLNRLIAAIGRRAAVLLAMFLLTLHPAAADAPRPAEERGEIRDDREKEVCGRVGLICIIGNTVTLDSIILEQLPLFPGEEFTLSDLRSAQRNLARLGLFKDPLVRIIDQENDSKYKYIGVYITERPFNIYLWAIEESLEFTAAWAVRGLPAAIFKAATEDTFPGELIRFVFTGNREGCPLVISHLLPGKEAWELVDRLRGDETKPR